MTGWYAITIAWCYQTMKLLYICDTNTTAGQGLLLIRVQRLKYQESGSIVVGEPEGKRGSLPEVQTMRSGKMAFLL